MKMRKAPARRAAASSVPIVLIFMQVSTPSVFPSSQRSIQSCPAGQLHNSKEVGRTKTKDLSSYFLERGVDAPSEAKAQTGWSDRSHVSPNRPSIEASPYRARASRPARQLLLSWRATPAMRGGECVPAIPRIFPLRAATAKPIAAEAGHYWLHRRAPS